MAFVSITKLAIILALITVFVSKVSGQLCMKSSVCVPFWECPSEEELEEADDEGLDIADVVQIRLGTPKPCAGFFDVCCKIRCGVRGSDNLNFDKGDVLRHRILGGDNEAKFAEFPWMLGVLHANTYRCGASLIHPKVALTAAHCVKPLSQHYIKVRAGEWNWDNAKEPLAHQDRSVSKVVIHPQFAELSLHNDIALLVLHKPFSLTESVGIMCLPPRNSFAPATGDCVAAGWGKNTYRTGKLQSVLKKVALPMMPRGRCLKSLQDARLGPRYILHRSFICAGGEANKDTCEGDGGSPLMCPILGQENRYEQVGIVSWGLTCGLKATPGVYVNVALFVSWIDAHMKMMNLDDQFYKY